MQWRIVVDLPYAGGAHIRGTHCFDKEVTAQTWWRMEVARMDNDSTRLAAGAKLTLYREMIDAKGQAVVSRVIGWATLGPLGEVEQAFSPF